MRPFVTPPIASTSPWRSRLGGLGAAPAIGGLCWAICVVQARMAQRAPRRYVEALPAGGRIGPPGAAIRVAWLGDSLASGLGVDHVDDTPAHLVSRLLERPVDVTVLAVPGARAVDVLDEQLPRLAQVDLVVLSVGANDVASPGSRRRYAERLDAVLAATAPIPTLVLSLPDMAIADRMAQPLRSVAGARARWFDAARARVAATHGHVRSIDITSRPPGLSRRAARAHLCADRFHPGPEGYRIWADRIATVAEVLLPPIGPPTRIDPTTAPS